MSCARSRPASAARRRASGEARRSLGRADAAGREGLGRVAFTMSARVILPLRPLPATVSRSTCNRSASLRRTARHRGPVPGPGASGTAVLGAVPADGTRLTRRRQRTQDGRGRCPRALPLRPGRRSRRRRRFRTPRSSMADFAVSTSAMTWPRWTSSPGFTYHWSKVPFSMSAPSAGMRNSLTSPRSLGSLMSYPSRLEPQQRRDRRSVTPPVRDG